MEAPAIGTGRTAQYAVSNGYEGRRKREDFKRELWYRSECRIGKGDGTYVQFR